MNLQSQSLEDAFQGLKMNRKSPNINQNNAKISSIQQIPSSFYKSYFFFFFEF